MTSQEQNAAPGAVAIQAAGNNITISVGATSLVLERKHRLSARRATTDLQLLLTDLRETDLVGREAELAALEAWLGADDEVSVRCLTGPGGAGKTRVAIELCERADANGWRAGFARHEGLAQDLSGWRWGGRTLVVVDYAAAVARDLRRWLEALTDREPGTTQLRLLLLERHARPGLVGPGVRRRRHDRVGTGYSALPAGAGAAARPPCHRGSSRAAGAGHAEALRDLSPPPQPPAPGTDPDFDRRLAEDGPDHEPLFLAMAGIVAVG